jgi:hypothetical protein
MSVLCGAYAALPLAIGRTLSRRTCAAISSVMKRAVIGVQT